MAEGVWIRASKTPNLPAESSSMWSGRLFRACLTAFALSAAAAIMHPAWAQTNFDRPGGDYLGSPSLSGDPAECAMVCERDKRCRAWTYARAGYTGRSAHCYLKKEIKPPRRRPGFVSGVVR